MVLDPGGRLAWLVVGLIAGWLAGQFMKGGGYGLSGDIVVGIIGGGYDNFHQGNNAYFVYADAAAVTSFGGAGHDQLGVARSTDLLHWSVPPH